MSDTYKVLDLFSGIGGFSLGLERAGMETIGFCEIDEYCNKVLRKHWPDVPIYTDITTLNGEEFYGRADVICGGFPCQPFSVAGELKGKKDDRDLWPQMFRVIKQTRPTWIIGENVANFVNMAFKRTKVDLESEGYSVQSYIIPACSIGAPHARNRIWIVAYSHSSFMQREWKPSRVQKEQSYSNSRSQYGKAVQSLVPYSHSIGQSGQRESINTCDKKKSTEGKAAQSLNGSIGDQWSIEPGMGRVADGIPDRAHRLKALGNAVVPQIPEILGKAIIKFSQENSR